MRFPAEHHVASREELVQRAAGARVRAIAFLAAEGIEEVAYLADLESGLVSLAGWLALRRIAGRPLVVGVSGAQGAGKSTLAKLLQLVLEDGYGLRCALLSLDDLYLTRAQRAELARDVHPLLRTRGVPGTHDVELGMQLFSALANREAARVAVPRFDKAVDDRAPVASWPEAVTPLDCIVFEGWCLGARAERDAELDVPMNALERESDSDGRFRRYVNQMLGGVYRRLFDRIDTLVFLAAPDLECSRAWRIEQERKLRARVGPDATTMSDEEIARFVQFYERISAHMSRDLPARADVVLELDREHRFRGVRVRAG